MMTKCMLFFKIIVTINKLRLNSTGYFDTEDEFISEE